MLPARDIRLLSGPSCTSGEMLCLRHQEDSACIGNNKSRYHVETCGLSGSLGPRKPTISPCDTSMETPFTTVLTPYFFYKVFATQFHVYLKYKLFHIQFKILYKILDFFIFDIRSFACSLGMYMVCFTSESGITETLRYTLSVPVSFLNVLSSSCSSFDSIQSF